MVDTHAVEILEHKDASAIGGRNLRPAIWCLCLLVCALAGSGIAEYRKLSPLAHERGLSTSILLKESFRRFDLAYAGIGLVAGIAILAVLVGTSRVRRAD